MDKDYKYKKVLRAGPVAAVGLNVALGGLAALQAEQHYLSLVHDKAGSIIKQLSRKDQRRYVWGLHHDWKNVSKLSNT